MPLAVSSLPWSAEVFAEFQSARREPAWLSAQRRDAWSAYREQLREPLDPEEYKRIDLRAFRPDKFALAPAGQALPTATLMQHCGDYAGNVSHVDGHCTQ
jgi:Fe-S cluster assembly protein SufD